MVLNDVVKMIPGDMYIGADEGSGFFFIGDLEEYEKEIDNTSRKIKARLDLHCKIREEELGTLLAQTNRDRYLLEAIENAKRRYNTLCKWRDEFINFREREVKEVYKKNIGTAIIVKGYEVGQYWTKEEWERSHASKT